MKVLITGAAGFVGTGLVRRLHLEPHFSVVAGVHRQTPTFDEPVAIVPLDLAAGDMSPGPFEGCDAVVHLAARVHVMRDRAADPLTEFRRVNVEGTANLARRAAASGVRRFVFLSSVKVHGEEGVFRESDAPAPQDPYGVSKAEAEDELRQVAAQTGLELVIVRPPLVYGPAVKANFALLIKAVRRGWPLPFGAVNNRRSIVGLDNLTDFLALCLQSDAVRGETFLVSDGHDVSTPALIEVIAGAVGRPARLMSVSPRLLVGAASAVGRSASMRRLVGTLQVDISKARAIGWIPPVPLAEGIRRAVADVR